MSARNRQTLCGTIARMVLRRGSGKMLFFVAAVARLLDLTGEFQPLPDSDPATAMYDDWKRVGDDLRHAMRVAAATTPTDAEIRALVEA